MHILIICDRFGIGGIERLALDQSYQLNDSQIFSEILILNRTPTVGTPTFQENEKELIEKLNIKIKYLPGSRREQFIELSKIITKANYDYIISHSLRGAVLVKLFRFKIRKKYVILTTIHQLPILSAPLQRLKRFFYSQFTDKLYIFSVAAQRDWDSNKKKNIFFRLLLSKKNIGLLRNGVYLPRIPIKEINKNIDPSTNKRLIFIGRLTAWKGLKTFLDLAQLPQLSAFNVLIVTPTDPKIYLSNIEENFRSRITCIIGKSISQINFKRGDLHLYPANYGKDSKFIEGISINVLEMASLGIPSLITKGGAETWPELIKLGIVFEVDWNNPNSVANFIESLPSDLSFTDIHEIRSIINIENNLKLALS
jgi:glycosyltransferase involved in cell wall biosynthesis